LVSLAAHLAVLGIGLAIVARGARHRALLVAISAAVLGHAVTDAFMTPEIAGSFSFWAVFGAGVALASGEPTGIRAP
jgi:hypothetical protein